MDSLFDSSFPFTEPAIHKSSEVGFEINSYDLMESNVNLKVRKNNELDFSWIYIAW